VTEDMTQTEAARRAWLAAEQAEHAADLSDFRQAAELARTWAAVAAQLPFIQPESVRLERVPMPCIDPDCARPAHSSDSQHVNGERRWRDAPPVPRPLERRDEPTNVQGAAEIAAAAAALRGEPVPDPRPLAVPRPGSIVELAGTGGGAVAECMCGVRLALHSKSGWLHANGGRVCPS
jgi:hypothetical protein